MDGFPQPGRRPLPTRRSAGPPMEAAGILLVDGNVALAELSAEYLRAAGYRVVAVAGLAEAEALLAGGRFALVLTEPFRLATGALGTDRWTNLRRIRALAGEAPVVICSEYRAADFAGYRERGFAEVLPKPYRPADLLATVRRLLGPPDAASMSPDLADPPAEPPGP